jgi:hypothetical protein
MPWGSVIDFGDFVLFLLQMLRESGPRAEVAAHIGLAEAGPGLRDVGF